MLTRSEVEANIRADAEPAMVEIRDGRAAVGVGWAVFGVDQAEARARYAEAERLHREIATRPGLSYQRGAASVAATAEGADAIEFHRAMAEAERDDRR